MDVLAGDLVPIDELTAEALAAEIDAPVEPSALPFGDVVGADEPEGILPSWYMPGTATTVHLTGWRRRVAWLIIATFIAIVSSGLCSTYGVLEIA